MEGIVAGARFLQFASTTILFGSSLFCLYGLERATQEERWPKWLLAGAACVALLSVVSVIASQALLLGGDFSAAADMAFMQSMLFETGFGRILTVRLAAAIAALLAALLLRGASLPLFARVLGGFGAVLMATFAGTGHGALNEGTAGVIHTGSDVAHNLAAGVWIGALVPIAILMSQALVPVGGRAIERAHHALAQFSGIGTGVVAVLVLSGIVNSWFLIGPDHIAQLFTTTYGVLLIVKLLLFGAMLALAAANRFWLTPLLARGPSDRSVRMLKLSVFSETSLAMLVLLAVGFIGTLEPPASSD